MAKNVEQFDDDEVSEILRLALRKQSSVDNELRSRLHAVADELGISREAVTEAEREYRQQTLQRQELGRYLRESRKALRIHAGVYGICSLFFIGINAMTYSEDHQIWFPAVMLTWGVGLGIHAFVTMRKVDVDDEEFQKWRSSRADG